jgi:hypothetical protein
MGAYGACSLLFCAYKRTGAFLPARSIIESTCWEDLDRIFRKMLICGLKEDAKAV